ncbi:MAG: hypothetical protein GY708_26415 [Actinomycetia bacterium]|nr:hypothetical protein [Actinomycetes bacterium]MCP4957992.1 hypothetical protein [Actinomycetes bacterium]
MARALFNRTLLTLAVLVSVEAVGVVESSGVPASAQTASGQAAVAQAVDSVFVSGDGGGGVYIVYSDGRVDARDGLPHHGDLPPLAVGETVVAMGAVDDASGYWLFTSLGRVYGYGAVTHHRDLGGFDLAAPVVAAAVRPDGGGYWVVGADGGIFSFGTARFYGSVPEVLPGVALAAPVIGISPSASGEGYLLVASDGGIFAFGDAVFHGSIPGVLPGVQLAEPVVGVVPQDGGYLMVASDGGVFNFGQSTFYGSLANVETNPITTIAVPPGDIGYTMIDQNGVPYPLGYGILLKWGWVVVQGTGAGEGIPVSYSPYEQPWGTPSLVSYEFSIPDAYPYRMSLLGRTADGTWVNTLAKQKSKDSSGFVIPEIYSDFLPIGEIGVDAGEGTSYRVGFAPVWYTPSLDVGDAVTMPDESVWVIDSATQQIEIEITRGGVGCLESVYLPAEPGLAPVPVSECVGLNVERYSAVVVGDGLLAVNSGYPYTVEVRAAP